MVDAPDSNTVRTTREAQAARGLTDRAVKALKPAPGRYEVWDEDTPGFGVRVAPSGLKTWILRYRSRGRKRRLKLGNLPSVSLADARRHARQALASVSLGSDPARAKQESQDAPTFGFLADVYLERHAIKKRTGDQDRRMIEREFLPKWRTTKAADIRRADVIALLDDIATGRGKRRRKGRPAPIQANRVLALLRKIYNFGIQRALVESNPCHLVPQPGVPRRRSRVLSEDEIRGLWAGLEQQPAVLAGAVKFMLLTAQRRGEVLRLRWEDIRKQGDEQWWTIPPEHAKNGLAHRVPLSPQATAVIEQMRLLAPSSAWVFAGRLKAGGYVKNVELAIDRAREQEGIAHFTPHDLRRTAASLMTGLGIPRLTVKKILNHADNDVTAIYDRHGYDAEKRSALVTWGARVAAITTARQDTQADNDRDAA